MKNNVISESNFIVRTSGRHENQYYIDYAGVYSIKDISKLVSVGVSIIQDKYVLNSGIYDESLDVYYFKSVENAKKTISDILNCLNSEKKGRAIYLSEAEIEFIRKALINEGSNTIHVQNKIKDAIFKKLNG